MAGKGFTVTDRMYFIKFAINEPFRSTVQHPQIEDIALNAIHKLLETYPLTPPPSTPPNRQPRTPNQKSGVIRLPLWQHTAEVNPSSPHWEAYERFIREMTPVIQSCSVIFQSYRKAEFDRARGMLAAKNTVRDRSTRLPQHTEENCFETLRLSVNLALAPASLRTSHRSPWAVVTFFGNWIAGELAWTSVQPPGTCTVPPDAGDVLIVRDGIPIGGQAFVGYKYQLELFLPDI